MSDHQKAEATDDYTTFGTLKLERPATLPEIVDVLIAGAGPGGTAAALRARELDLSALVIDSAEILQTIRDFEQDKTVVPDYGVRASKPFPPGGPLISGLRFDEIPAVDLVAQWVGRYVENGIAARIGLELTGLSRGADGVWQVKAWSHRARQDFSYRARNVIIALGGGVPRRFDIPGKLDGIRFRLDAAANFVGGPALVIGGGISAAEAVIAISNAKAQGEDATAVYWAYRGEKLPRVAESKALGPRFYDAYVGNGNIRYLPNSDPAAVFAGPDKRDYLLLRIDRKIIAGRPIETVHLEFEKTQVVACIGGDLPFKLLEEFGAKVPTVNDKRYMLVNASGELSLPGVFLVGDARGGKLLRCTDFDDPHTYEWIAAGRNMKEAIWEGVLAAETIALRLGNAHAAVALAAATTPSGKPLEGRSPAIGSNAESVADQAPVLPASQAMPAAQPPPPAVAQLESLLPDGSVETEFPLTKPVCTLGRSGADFASPEDVYQSNVHARIRQNENEYELEDAGSDTGTWLRIRGIDGYHLEDGDLVWAGAQILMARRRGAAWDVIHYDNRGSLRATYPIDPKGLFIGRGGGIALDESDASLSRRHAQFRVDAHGLRVFDLGSTNGTLVKVGGPVALRDGDEFRIGTRRFRFERLEAVAPLRVGDVVIDTPSAAGVPIVSAAVGTAPVVTVRDSSHPVTFSVMPAQNVLQGFFTYLDTREPGCDHAKFHKRPLDWSCLKGTCGICVVRVLDGAANLEPIAVGSPELDTLENKSLVAPDPQQFRLTCVARVMGPVTFGIVE